LIRRGRPDQQKQRYYKLNQRINAPELRVLDDQGEQIGVMSRNEALDLARNQELDLVEIAPLAKPPVARIINFKKFLYQQEKKKKEEKRKAKVSETKEIRLGPFMSDNDLQVRIKQGREFIEDGDKLRLVVKFKGRQITHPEFGRKVTEKYIEALSDIAKVDRPPHFEGRQMVAILSVEKGKKLTVENRHPERSEGTRGDQEKSINNKEN
jgi:translation initiation factor IF-3